MRVHELMVDQAALVEWDLARGQMTVTSWSSDRGVRSTTSAYP